MDQSAIEAHFQDLRRNLVQAFQTLGQFLADFKNQLADVKTSVEAIRAQTAGPPPAAAPALPPDLVDSLIRKVELQQGLQLIGQHLGALTGEVRQVKAAAQQGGGAALDPSVVAALAHVGQLPPAIAEISATVERLQHGLDSRALQDAETSGQLTAQLQTMEATLRAVWEQVAAVAAAGGSGGGDLATRLQGLDEFVRSRLATPDGTAAQLTALSTQFETLSQAVLTLQTAVTTSNGGEAEALLRQQAEQLQRLESTLLTTTPADPREALAELPQQVAAAVAAAGQAQPEWVTGLHGHMDYVTQTLSQALAAPTTLPPEADALLRQQAEQIQRLATLLEARVAEQPDVAELLRQQSEQMARLEAGVLAAAPPDPRELLADLPERVAAAIPSPPETPAWVDGFHADLQALSERIAVGTSGADAPDVTEEVRQLLEERIGRLEGRLRDEVANALAGMVTSSGGDGQTLQADAVAMQQVLGRLDELAEQVARAGAADGDGSPDGDWVTRLETRLEELTQRPTPVTVDLAPLEARLDALGAAAQQAVPGDGTGGVDLSPVQARLDELAAAIREQAGSPTTNGSGVTAEDLAALEQRLAGALADVRAQLDAPSATAGGLTAADLASLEERFVAALGELRAQLAAPGATGSADNTLVERIEARLGHLAQPATAVDLTPVEAQLETIRASVQLLGSAPAGGVTPADLAALQAHFERGLEQVRAAVAAPAADGQGAQLQALEDGLQQLAQRLDTLAPADPTVAIQSLASSLEQRLERIENQAKAEPSANGDGLNSIAQRLEALDRRLATLGTSDATAAVEALAARLDERLERLEDEIRKPRVMVPPAPGRQPAAAPTPKSTPAAAAPTPTPAPIPTPTPTAAPTDAAVPEAPDLMKVFGGPTPAAPTPATPAPTPTAPAPTPTPAPAPQPEPDTSADDMSRLLLEQFGLDQ